MERRTLIFVAASLFIWYTWLLLNPQPETALPTDDGPVAVGAKGPAAPVQPTTAPVLPPVKGDRTLPVTGCQTSAQWSNLGGGLSDLLILDRKAPYTVTPIYSWALGGFGSWAPYGGDPGPARVLTAASRSFAIGAGAYANQVVLEGSGTQGKGTVDGIEVEQSLREVPGDPCRFELSYRWTNHGTTRYDGPLWVAVHDVVPEAGGMFDHYSSHSAAQAGIDGELWTLYEYGELVTPYEPIAGSTEWFGLGDRYFAAYAVPETPHGSIVQTRLSRGAEVPPLDGMHWIASSSLEPGASHSERVVLYVGQKDTKALEAISPPLANSVELGWFSFFGTPLVAVLNFFHGLLGNWGLAIILLTVCIKLLFYPLTQSAYRSTEGMRSIQPELDRIRKVYKDEPEELSKRTMALFRDNRVNPVGGCLPMILQIPVWIALYNVLLSSVELYQTEFLYLRDLSSLDPYGVLPLAVVAAMALQQSFMPTANMDPAQAQMMKVMPIFMGIFFFMLPSGLVIYMFVNIVLSVLQQWYIKRSFEPRAPTPSAA